MAHDYESAAPRRSVDISTKCRSPAHFGLAFAGCCLILRSHRPQQVAVWDPVGAPQTIAVFETCVGTVAGGGAAVPCDHCSELDLEAVRDPVPPAVTWVGYTDRLNLVPLMSTQVTWGYRGAVPLVTDGEKQQRGLAVCAGETFFQVHVLPQVPVPTMPCTTTCMPSKQ